MKSLSELKAIRERMRTQIGIRNENTDGTRIVVGMATCGIASGARPVLMALVDEVNSCNLENVSVVQTGCIGLCQYEPIVEVYRAGEEKVTYIKMTPDKAKEVLMKHVLGGQIVTEYTLKDVKI